ncbi:3-ketoacyl-ACP reductase [Cryobacterium roopkundense]|uniref:3-ketoacyl-ACP reductase n=1 Tax=Cryobacterium roopkundense TaxID=1001240 RepID=A0A099JA58_9MICO|nr:SDR family oxidoreductase [Cryobacterium roopkundense]KGJ75151.1 3-ketoacyl-ACP reductase [Cryobacterium roopkundense]MBB5642954.1 NAD(P)-dependent dehydrogenase (short-subunit alcohol dehydrogenase family) [Cryobacterium roopkundense]
MSNATPRLAGKTALVTGASRGIGLAIAHRLAAEGARVCITARGAQPLQQAVAEFPADSVIAVAGKSHDPAHRAEVLDTVAREFGSLNILVNNVGINPVYGPLIDLDLDAARKIAEVNLFGTLAWVQDLVHHPGLDFATRGGSVINMSSVTGETASPGIGFYGITKAAVAHLTRTLAAEMGPTVRVNAVAPAVVKTQFAKALYEGKEAEVAAQYPLGRLGLPDDVAAAVAFLASDDAGWISGQVLNLDGGLLAAGGVA